MAEENAYITRERPWEHADLLVYGGESIPYDRETEVVLGRPRVSSPADTRDRPVIDLADLPGVHVVAKPDPHGLPAPDLSRRPHAAWGADARGAGYGGRRRGVYAVRRSG